MFGYIKQLISETYIFRTPIRDSLSHHSTRTAEVILSFRPGLLRICWLDDQKRLCRKMAPSATVIIFHVFHYPKRKTHPKNLTSRPVSLCISMTNSAYFLHFNYTKHGETASELTPNDRFIEIFNEFVKNILLVMRAKIL